MGVVLLQQMESLVQRAMGELAEMGIPEQEEQVMVWVAHMVVEEEEMEMMWDCLAEAGEVEVILEAVVVKEGRMKVLVEAGVEAAIHHH